MNCWDSRLDIYVMFYIKKKNFQTLKRITCYVYLVYNNSLYVMFYVPNNINNNKYNSIKKNKKNYLNHNTVIN